MELKLAEGEEIVKSWDYAISGKLFQRNVKKIHSNLTVTNKRVVATDYNDIYVNRNEISVANIKAISGTFKRNRSFWSMVKLIIGIPLCLVIVGIFMVKKALDEMKAAKFDLELTTTDKEGMGLAVGALNEGPAKKERGGIFGAIAKLFKKARTTKVQVNKEIAKEVIDEIGAVILNQQ